MVPRPGHAARAQQPPCSSSGELELPSPPPPHTHARRAAPSRPTSPRRASHRCPPPQPSRAPGRASDGHLAPGPNPRSATGASFRANVSLPNSKSYLTTPRKATGRASAQTTQSHHCSAAPPPTGAAPGPQLGPPAQLHPQQEDAQEGTVRALGQGAARERHGNQTPRKGWARDQRRGPGGMRGAAQKQLWGVVEGARWGRGALASGVRLPKVGHGGAGPS